VWTTPSPASMATTTLADVTPGNGADQLGSGEPPEFSDTRSARIPMIRMALQPSARRTHGEGNLQHVGDSARPTFIVAPGLRACRDVEKDPVRRPRRRYRTSELDRITTFAQSDEVDALHHATVGPRQDRINGREASLEKAKPPTRSFRGGIVRPRRAVDPTVTPSDVAHCRGRSRRGWAK